jgi:membrane peptidoglycan carboxypeptidase
MTSGTGAGVQIGRPAGGKTGTTNDTIAVWFVGYTPDLSTAVWAGNPSPPPGGYPLQNLVIGGTYYGDVCGGCLPGPIWQQMMSEALANVPASTFTDPTEDIVQGESISVPSVSGMGVEQAKRALRKVELEPVVSYDEVYASYAPEGTVAYSYPGTGSAVYPGQRVVLYISAGAPPAPEEPPSDEPTIGPEPGNGNGGRNGGGGGNGGAPGQGGGNGD